MSLDASELLALVEGTRRQLERLDLPDTGVAICAAALARMEKVLARPPRIAILGEINSGKTSIADLLLGVGLLPASVVANTRYPVLMKHGETTALYAIGDGGRRKLTERDIDQLPYISGLKGFEVRLPSPRLAEFEILDTPGLGDGTTAKVDADVFLWCTVATRAWTESERASWMAFPERCRRNGLLVATHKDALQGPSEVIKIERRLRTVTSSMFRDLILVSAVEGPRARALAMPGADGTADALVERVREWIAEISERRARKAERIIRRLARLTFHQLVPAPLRTEEAAFLRAWEVDSGRLLGRLDYTAADPGNVIRSLLFRFAQSMEKVRPGWIARGPARGLPAPLIGETAAWPMRRLAARRYARLIAADLTGLLRIELARSGLRDGSLFARYVTARSILLALANLDTVFADLGDRLAATGAMGMPQDVRGAERIIVPSY